MGLETSDTINGLNANWPLGTDKKGEGDDHLRLIKTVLQAVFDDTLATDPAGVPQLVIKNEAGTILATFQEGALVGEYAIIGALLADLNVKANNGAQAVVQVKLQDFTDKTRLALAANITSKTGVLIVYDTNGTTELQRLTVGATGINVQNGVGAGNVLTTGNIAYQGHAQNETTFPVSTILSACATTGAIARQAPVIVYQHATDAGVYLMDGNIGAQLAGTWSCRGRSTFTAVGGQFGYAVERIG